MDDCFGGDERHPLLEERITSNPAIMFGKPTVRGTRLTVERVLEFLADDDWSRIHDAFPDTTEDDVHACAAFGAERVREAWKSDRRVRSGAA